MDAKKTTLEPELVKLVATHCGRPPEDLHPFTHVVFDLGIDGEDIDELVHAIENHFVFVGTDAEWGSVSSLGEIDGLVRRLRGTSRPEVLIELERNAAAVAQRGHRLMAVIAAWLGVGVVSYFAHRPTFMGWVATSVLGLLVFTAGVTYRGVRARLRWKQERRARYGV